LNLTATLLPPLLAVSAGCRSTSPAYDSGESAEAQLDFPCPFELFVMCEPGLMPTMRAGDVDAGKDQIAILIRNVSGYMVQGRIGYYKFGVEVGELKVQSEVRTIPGPTFAFEITPNMGVFFTEAIGLNREDAGPGPYRCSAEVPVDGAGLARAIGSRGY